MTLDLDHFRTRVLQDAMQESLRSYWLRRAEAFDAAMHRPGDFPGCSSVDQIEAANQLLAGKALACRRHADLVAFQNVETMLNDLQEAA